MPGFHDILDFTDDRETPRIQPETHVMQGCLTGYAGRHLLGNLYRQRGVREAESGQVYHSQMQEEAMMTRCYAMNSTESAQWFDERPSVRVPFRRQLLQQLDAQASERGASWRRILVYDVHESLVAERLLHSSK